MLDNDDSVTKKLLSPNITPIHNMNSAVIENEKGTGSSGKSGSSEPDLRLHDAVCIEDAEEIEELQDLLDKEPHLLFERDKDGRCPIHTVAIDANEMAPQITKLLLGVSESHDGSRLLSIERPELLRLQDSLNYTVLHYAALNRDEGLVAALLRWGADPYLQDLKGNTPLHLASEGKRENALECGKHLLKADVNKSLINMTNCEDKTALHKAIDERSILMCNFLLRPEYAFNLSQQDSQGWNVLHYICSGTEENEALLSIVKTIISRAKPSQLNQLDKKKRTPLILAAIQRLPQIAQLLVNEDKTDVLIGDEQLKTALHYACQNGCYPNGTKCVDVLIGRKFTERAVALKYLYRNEDGKGHTPFMYACLNCPPESVQNYLNSVNDPYYWLTGTYSQMLYKHCPLALKTLMDKAFTEDKKRNTDIEDDILVDYGPITGYSDTVENSPQQETTYLKQALYWDYDTQREILLHPLVQLFMLRKWHKLRWIILTWVLWQLIWLGAFTTLVVTYYSNEKTHSKPAAIISSFVMLIYILTSVVNEGFEFYTVKCSYLYSLTNVTQMAQFFLALIAIAPVLYGSDGPETWQKYATATGILLAYILSMRDIGKLHNKIGLIVEVLKQVMIQILHVLMCCAPLIIGFTLCFLVIFDDEALNSAFPGPFVKVLVMMTGEFNDFSFNDETEGGEGGKVLTSYRVLRLFFFLAFLISVPVAFFNLLTGFALDKVMELRERAKVGRIAKQLEHIYFIESILLSLRPLGKVLPMFPYENCLRKLNVTTAWIDQKRSFYTLIREKIRQPNEGRKNLTRKRVQGCFAGLIPSFCNSRVPVEVEQQIFALATANSNPDLVVEKKCATCLK